MEVQSMRSSKSISNFPAVLANFVAVLLNIGQVDSEQNTFVIPKPFRTAKFSLSGISTNYISNSSVSWGYQVIVTYKTLLTGSNLFGVKSNCLSLYSKGNSLGIYKKKSKLN